MNGAERFVCPPICPLVAQCPWLRTVRFMTVNDNDLKTLRRYSRQETAALLHISDSWLKGWVTEDAVPHQRSGKPGPRQRGVWFTYDDVLAIGKLMPSLMTARRANKRAEAELRQAPRQPVAEDALSPTGTEVAPSLNTLPDDEWAAFGGLVSLRA